MGRVREVQAAVIAFFRRVFPGVEVVRSYMPTYVIQNTDIGKTRLVVALEDIVTERNNANGMKFTDVFTFTLAVLCRLESTQDATEEADRCLELVESIRDALRLRITTQEGLRLVISGAEHAASRPIYDRALLEDDNIFAGYLLLEVRSNGICGNRS